MITGILVAYIIDYMYCFFQCITQCKAPQPIGYKGVLLCADVSTTAICFGYFLDIVQQIEFLQVLAGKLGAGLMFIHSPSIKTVVDIGGHYIFAGTL